MSDLKRIMISLPDYLLEEVDDIVALEKRIEVNLYAKL